MITLLFALDPTAQGQACTPLPGSIVAWWRAESNALDSIGNATGVLAGNEVFTPGEVGLGFSGSSPGCGVFVANTTALQLQTLTIEAWVKRSNTNLVANGSGGFAFLVGFVAGGYSFFLDPQGHPGFNRFGDQANYSSVAIDDTKFHHVAVTVGANTLNFYLDGANTGTLNYSRNFSFSGGLGIGYRPDNGTDSFFGVIDEVSIYSRALEANEILAIYNSGSAGKCATNAPVIAHQPLSQNAFAGNAAILSASASGNPPFSYNWSFSGTNIAGATNSTLILTNLSSTQSGNYAVVVSNAYGFAVSSNAVLTVNPSLSCVPLPYGIVGWWRAEDNAQDTIGNATGNLVGNESYGLGEVGLGFVGDGSGDGVLVTNTTALQLQTLTIEAWVKRSSATLVSTGSGGNGIIAGFGSGGYLFFLDGQGHPIFAKIGESPAIGSGVAITDTNFHQLAVSLGSGIVTLYEDGGIVATNSYGTTFTYSSGFGIGFRPDTGDNGFFGSIDEVSIYNRVLAPSELQAIYSAGPAGKCFDHPPVIGLQPTNHTIYVGAAASFSVAVSSIYPVYFQWMLNGTNVLGATNATLTLPRVPFSAAGNYSVVVSNAYGFVESSNAVLTLNPLPPCVSLPSGLVGWWRAEGNAQDALGNAPGSLIGNESYGPGEVGLGFLGDGSSEGVLATNNTALQLQTLTIEAWVQRASTNQVSEGSGGNGIVAGFGGGGYVLYLDGGGRPTFTKLGDAPALAGSVAITDTNFHHLAASLGSGVLNLYLDGANSGTVSYNPSFAFSTGFGIGFRPDNNDNGFLGTIDELSIYNRALSPSEVLAIYLEGSIGKCVHNPPVIDLQPTNQTAYVGKSAAFSVVAASTSPLFYQWMFNNTNVTGATNSTLVLPGVQFSSVGNYFVVITNADGFAVSSNALLTVSPTPPCDSAPSGLVGWWRAEANAMNYAGSDVAVLVGNESYGLGEVGLGFVGDGSGDGVLVTNTTALQLQTLTIEAWVERSSTSQVSQGSGGNGIIVGFGGGGYALYLDSQGRPIFAKLGDSLALAGSVAITDTNYHHLAVSLGAGALNLYVDGANVGMVGYNPSFSFSTGLGIGFRPDNSDNSFYGTIDEVSIYNRALQPNEILAIFGAQSAGKCSMNAPVFVQQPVSQNVFAGNAAILSASASGIPPASYHWTFDGTNIAGATNATLILTDLQIAQGGNYAVVVSNAFGFGVSSNAVLTVNPSLVCDPLPYGIVGWWRAEGSAQDAIGNASGTLIGNETYGTGEDGLGFMGDGFGDGVLVTNTTNLQLQILTIEAWVQRGSSNQVSQGSGGNGIVAGFGSGGYLLYLDSGGRPTFTKLGDAPALAGSVAITDTNFHHLAVSLGAGVLNLYVDGANVGMVGYNSSFSFSSGLGIGFRPDNYDNSFNGTIDEVSIYNRALQPSEILGIYNARSGGKCIHSPPVIGLQPTNQSAYLGTTAAFSVFASSTTTLFYQWSLNSTNLPGATNATLILPAVQISSVGNYSVVISNADGVTVSSNAELTLIPTPPCDPPPSGLVGWWRGESNAFNYAGNGDGILVGNENYGPGEVGLGFVADGSGDGVLVTNITALQLQTLTIEAWVRRASSSVVSFGSGGNGIVAGFGNGGYLLYLDSSGRPNFARLGDPSTSSGSVLINDVNFHHLAATLGSGVLKLYLDGTNTDTSAFSSVFTFSSGLGIGFRPDNGDNSFLGTIDELSIYNRALASNEVMAIYQAAQGGKCYVPSAPIITQQPMNETLSTGGTIALAATVVGTPPMYFQWNFEGTGIPGATNTTLVVNDAQANDAGDYSLIATNPLGSTNSNDAVVKVIIVTLYANGQSQTNSQATFPGMVTLQFSNYYSDGYIFYTLDGTTPTPFSPYYNGPITVSNTVEIRTLAFSEDFLQSAYSDPFMLLVVPSYSLNASTPGGGAVSLNPFASAYVSNTLVTITATPSNGWTFLQWLGDAFGTNQTNAVLLNRNKSVQAIFGTTVTNSAGGGGSVVFNPAGPMFPYGYTLLASAIPLPGKVFVLWGKSASGNTNPLPFQVITPNAEISALFASGLTNQVSLTVTPAGHGKILINPASNIFSIGQSVTITANPDPGKLFYGWSGDASGNQNPLGVVMNKSKLIHANFSTNDFLSISLYASNSLAGGIEVDLAGEIGTHYRLDASTNLASWIQLLDMTNFAGSLHFLDLSASNQPRKFYRSVILP